MRRTRKKPYTPESQRHTQRWQARIDPYLHERVIHAMEQCGRGQKEVTEQALELWLDKMKEMGMV